MMRMFRALACCASLFLIPSTAWANNTTSPNAYSLMPGGTPAEAFLSDTESQRWYTFNMVTGRSYCAETQGGVNFDTSGTAGNIDTVLAVFRQDGTTLVTSTNDDAATEPRGYRLSRVCWIAQFNELAMVRVTRFNTGTFFYVRTRVVETTMFSPWFYVGESYNAFTLLRNTTTSTVAYTVNWRNASGGIAGTLSGSLPPNGSTFINGRDLAGVAATVFGTVDIAFNGSPQAVVANTTVLSPETGLSFDAPFTQRATW